MAFKLQSGPWDAETNFYMLPTENVYIDIMLFVKRSIWDGPFNRRIHEMKLRIQNEMY